jgi:hypothetical protein
MNFFLTITDKIISESITLFSWNTLYIGYQINIYQRKFKEEAFKIYVLKDILNNAEAITQTSDPRYV